MVINNYEDLMAKQSLAYDMEEKGFSQTDISKKLNVDRKTLYVWRKQKEQEDTQLWMFIHLDKVVDNKIYTIEDLKEDKLFSLDYALFLKSRIGLFETAEDLVINEQYKLLLKVRSDMKAEEEAIKKMKSLSEVAKLLNCSEDFIQKQLNEETLDFGTDYKLNVFGKYFFSEIGIAKLKRFLEVS